MEANMIGDALCKFLALCLVLTLIDVDTNEVRHKASVAFLSAPEAKGILQQSSCPPKFLATVCGWFHSILQALRI